MKKRIIMILTAASLMAVSGCGAAGISQEAKTAGAQTVAESEQVLVHAAEGADISALSDSTITVNGTGEIKCEPDMAEVMLAIETNEATVEEAQKKNAEETNAVLKTLSEEGIEETSIQTSDYSVYPRYDDFGEEITSYYVSTTLTVSDIPLGNVGKLLSACGRSGITEVRNVQYFYSGYDETYETALGEAVAAAEKKAAALSAASGKGLDGIVSITEGYQDTSFRYVYDNGEALYSAKEEAMDMGTGADIMPGEVTVKAEVTVIYKLK
ncbi:MAG: SIMPL domain-containing protein [Lachnospiraceae bacterium]|nr:SIMPL domain-containing protein [Lachnospiraceae bacterium]